MTLTWQAMRADDMTAWIDLRAAVEAVDKTAEHVGPDQFAELMGDPDLGSVAGFDGDEMVAAGVVWSKSGQTEVNAVVLEGHVRPSHRRRGIGRELLDRLAEVARAQHVERCPELSLLLKVPVHAVNVGHTALVTAAGYVPARWFFDMRVGLADEPPGLVIPDGLTAEPYSDGIDEELRIANNEVFAEHWGSSPSDQPYWQVHMTKNPAFVRDLCVVLRDDASGEIAAHIMSYYTPAPTDHRELWIGQVGTRKAWRGRGIATALLATVLRQARASAYETVGLAVDADNATGAFGVYERCGFAVVGRWTTYALTP
jgi:mycothiol synthase